MIPASVRIFVCTEPQDMRCSFDGLAAAAKRAVGEEPRNGALFCFVNKRSNRLKILWWDRNGYCLLYKRLHKALFRPPQKSKTNSDSIAIDAKQLAALISGVKKEHLQRKHNPNRQ